MTDHENRVLYHFTGSGDATNHKRNLGVLRSILSSMEIRPRSVEGRAGMTIALDSGRPIKEGEPARQSVASFCDIPLSHMKIHASKYGLFGVGVDRRKVSYYGGRPVIYLPYLRDSGAGMNNSFCERAVDAYDDLGVHFPQERNGTPRKVPRRAESAEDASQLARGFLLKEVIAFTKRFDVDLADEYPDNYYMEREWRKFGRLELYECLIEIVAPACHHDELKAEFPHVRGCVFKSI